MPPILFMLLALVPVMGADEAEYPEVEEAEKLLNRPNPEAGGGPPPEIAVLASLLA